jgi:hypothetical protein
VEKLPFLWAMATQLRNEKILISGMKLYLALKA